MIVQSVAQCELLKQQWTGKFVRVKDRPELRRFRNTIGRVVTVNYNGKAIIDFQDGAWYDIAASEDNLTVVDPAEAAAFNAKANSAQPIPDKQG